MCLINISKIQDSAQIETCHRALLVGVRFHTIIFASLLGCTGISINSSRDILLIDCDYIVYRLKIAAKEEKKIKVETLSL